MKKPTGFIAVCQCGEIVNAIDYLRTGKKESGIILGRWLHEGYTVMPVFDLSWSVSLKPCKCVV